MPFNLLLLPLLGGFLFASHWKRTSPLVARSDRTRLLLIAALAGVALLGIARILVALALSVPAFEPAILAFKKIVPFDYSGTAFLSLVLAPIASVFLNAVDPSTPLEILRGQVQERGDSLERFFLDASARAQANQDALIMLSMDDRKVYVGWVQRLPRDPTSPDSYLKFVPLASGYRTSETLEVNFTQFYAQAIEELAKIEGDRAVFDDFTKILPVRCIKSAGYFNFDAFAAFQSQTADAQLDLLPESSSEMQAREADLPSTPT